MYHVNVRVPVYRTTTTTDSSQCDRLYRIKMTAKENFMLQAVNHQLNKTLKKEENVISFQNGHVGIVLAESALHEFFTGVRKTSNQVTDAKTN